VRKWSVDEYHRLIEQGYFNGDERYELLEGWIVAKMPRTPLHDAVITIVDAALRPWLPAEWLLRVQLGVTLADSEPEPDLAIVAGPMRRYVQRHPGPADIQVIVEVAASSIDLDRADKGRVYAAAGVPVYVIVNVNVPQVEMYTNPTGSGAAATYGALEIFSATESLPLIITGKKIAEIPIAELLP
jgi:Uma2 family endonuclease